MAAATLLLADDSITIQRVIELTFADEQVRVIAAADGQQAIQRIDQDRPDIVLADVGMPKVDGYGVATYVKKTPALQHIPVLLLTGAFAPIDESRARATGCDGVLVKPFEPEKLIERVKELLAGTRSADLWPADMPRVDPPATVPAFAQPIAPTPTVPTPPIALAPPPPPAPQPVRDVPPAPIEVAPPPVVVRRAEPVVPPPPSPAPPVTPQAAGARFLEPPPPAARVAPATRLAPPADALDSQLDMLDMALSKLEPTASPHELDAATASDFARDLQALRQPGGADLPPVTPESAPAPRGAFGDWDLPAVPAARTNDLMDFGLPPRGAPNGAMTGAMSDAINDAIDLDPIELPAATAGPAPLPLPTSVPSVPPAPPGIWA